MNTIVFTRPMREELRTAYLSASKAGIKEFQWRGHDLVTDYVKYLLVFLDKNL